MDKEEWQEYARQLYTSLDDLLTLFIPYNGEDYIAVRESLELLRQGHEQHGWPLTLGLAERLKARNNT